MGFIRLTEEKCHLSFYPKLWLFLFPFYLNLLALVPSSFPTRLLLNKKTAGLGHTEIGTLIHVPVDLGKKPMQVLNFIMINPWHPLITRLYLPIR